MMAFKVTLISSDGEKFTVDSDVAKVSKFVENLLKDHQDIVGNETKEITLPDINGKILRLVLKWCTDHKDDPQSQLNEGQNFTEPESEFFAGIDQKTVFELILAGHVLDIDGLRNACCKWVANMVLGKEPDVIREIFQLRIE